jgi:hypothetical protein
MSTVKNLAIMGVLLLSAVSPCGHAALITWDLHDVTLEETQSSAQPGRRFSATGSFVYDAQTHLVSAWRIAVDGLVQFAPDVPCVLPGCSNTAQQFPGPNPGTDELLFEHNDASPAASPTFTLIAPTLTDAGGTKSLINVPGFAGYAQGGAGAVFADVIFGSISAVPEPGMAACIAIGLAAALGGIRRRTRIGPIGSTPGMS